MQHCIGYTVVPDKLEHLPYDLVHCQIQATWSCYLSIVGCRKKYLNKQRWLLIGPVCIKNFQTNYCNYLIDINPHYKLPDRAIQPSSFFMSFLNYEEGIYDQSCLKQILRFFIVVHWCTKI